MQGGFSESFLESSWWKIMEKLKDLLLSSEFDVRECTQRAICWYIKQSLANNVNKGDADFDHTVDTLARK